MSEEEKIGKNLFEYNGIIYTDNIPKNMFISITKEQYAEYMQQKEMIQQQQKEIEELKKCYVIKPKELEKEINKEWQNKIKAKIKKEEKHQETTKKVFQGSLNYHMQKYAVEVLKELLEE